MAEELVIERMLSWLAEDIPFWDLTSELLPESCECKAAIIAKEPGVAACVEEVALFLDRMGFKVKLNVRSGDNFEKGSELMTVEGSLKKLLQVERLALNLLTHTCGIAATTRKAVQIAKRANPTVRIAATRKTLPGLRYFEKRAVEAGGGDTHRLSLSDMVLIKDNHLKYFPSVRVAVETARARASFAAKIEVEVSNPKQAIEAAEAGADIIMLDNFSVQDVREAIEALKKAGLRDRVIVEVSGGITLENLEEYVRAGPDVISMGLLTHSAKAIDLSLEVIEVTGQCGESR
jgi:nicotinate-nucleotide pyrophosphorylase (carboxylating)